MPTGLTGEALERALAKMEAKRLHDLAKGIHHIDIITAGPRDDSPRHAQCSVCKTSGPTRATIALASADGEE